MADFLVYGKRETYHELGSFELKVVLDPKRFKDARGSELSFLDSDRKPIRSEVKMWGRKLNCRFVLDESVADGVAIVNMVLRDGLGSFSSGSFTFWVVK